MVKSQFNEKIKNRLHLEQNKHLSIFALAPIPLLIYFGHLLSDIPTADVYQLHREPQSWEWQPHPEEFEFTIRKSKNYSSVVALNISLSATINNERITDVLGEDISIWTITIDHPYNDFLKSKEQLQMFRETFRKALNEIKAVHDSAKELHVFPALPVSIGIEIGRIRMPKADLPFVIYDENKKNGGFKKTIDLV
ncbi:SAVED domain-containing protein [Alkalicoccus luteus]|uniref:SAVED domain-containing protein n=1 Tax=Alkalicoccus luteus TaxID=1237094 RepID=UPI00197B1254|nr:SAVED domain-containing protein [Alkalicoccus luteus]